MILQQKILRNRFAASSNLEDPDDKEPLLIEFLFSFDLQKLYDEQKKIPEKHCNYNIFDAFSAHCYAMHRYALTCL